MSGCGGGCGCASCAGVASAGPARVTSVAPTRAAPGECQNPPPSTSEAVDAREVDDRSRLAEDAPPPELGMTYWKTRVHRVLSQRYRVSPGTRTVRIPLDSRLLMLGEGLDPYTGRMWVKVQVTGELSASVKVLWTLPESARSCTYLSTSLAVDQVVELPLWSGPIPHGVEVELSFVNNGVAADARVTLDAMAKRRGSNFDTGMWLRSDAGSYRPERLGLWEPDEDPEGSASVVPAGACVKTLSHGGVHAGPMRVPDREDPRWCCTPDESATDWVDPRVETEFWDVQTGCAPQTSPDPELVATLKLIEPLVISGAGSGQFSFEFSPFQVIQPSLAATPHALAKGFVFQGFAAMGVGPVRYPSTPVEQGMPTLMESVGRCQGFDDLWSEVSFGLEDRRLPRAILSLLLPEQMGSRNMDRWLRMTEIIDADGPMDTDWSWRVTAPWLSGDVDMWQTWYMVSLLNLIHATTQLIPDQINSPYGLTERRRLRKSKRIARHKIQSSQVIWRLQGSQPPFLRIWGGNRSSLTPVLSSFNLATMAWQSPPWGSFLPAKFNIKNGSSPKGQTLGFPAPVPSTFTISEWFWLPYADAARQLYALARMLTMMALAEKRYTWSADERNEPIERTPRERELLAAAQATYRHYLTCLALPAKTAIHELFHTYRSAELGVALAGFGTSVPGTGAVLLAAWIKKSLRALHCPSGCGQEKMATMWLSRVGSLTAFIPVSFSPGVAITLPPPYSSPTTALSISNGIQAPQGFSYVNQWGAFRFPTFTAQCSRLDGGFFLASLFRRWPTQPGEKVELVWRIMDAAGSTPFPAGTARRFRKVCWNPGMNVKHRIGGRHSIAVNYLIGSGLIKP